MPLLRPKLTKVEVLSKAIILSADIKANSNPGMAIVKRRVDIAHNSASLLLAMRSSLHACSNDYIIKSTMCLLLTLQLRSMAVAKGFPALRQSNSLKVMLV